MSGFTFRLNLHEFRRLLLCPWNRMLAQANSLSCVADTHQRLLYGMQFVDSSNINIYASSH